MKSSIKNKKEEAEYRLVFEFSNQNSEMIKKLERIITTHKLPTKPKK